MNTTLIEVVGSAMAFFVVIGCIAWQIRVRARRWRAALDTYAARELADAGRARRA
jgi:hypothetical protein